MNWTELLTAEIDDKFRATESLLARVDDSMLDFKPASGENWMTLAQLVHHLPEACGFCMRGFVTGDWPAPEGADPDAPPEMPSAESMASAKSVAEAKERLAADKELAHAMLKEAGEERLSTEECPAPWDPTPMVLGRRLLGMVEHLSMHRAQLFYYLKLMGKPVDTMSLYGMD
jgi:uncharacterized damage-inducible protein DinB